MCYGRYEGKHEDTCPRRRREDTAPPIGLMPRWRWLELRRDEVRAAIQRYLEAGLNAPDKWHHELIDLRVLCGKDEPMTAPQDRGRACVSHHHACDCREARFAQELKLARMLLDAVENEERALASEDPTVYHQHGNFYEWTRAAVASYRRFLDEGKS